MDDSDDYFGDDDFILDEQTAAALDESERKHTTQGQTLSESRIPVQPVTKRLKTNTGWAPGFGARTESLADVDLPEISVQDNGGYSIANSNGGNHSSYNVEQPLAQGFVRRPQSVQPQRLLDNRQRSVYAHNSRPLSHPRQAPIGHRYGQQYRPPAQPIQGSPRDPYSSMVDTRNVDPIRTPLDEDMRRLNAQLEELRHSNEKMKSELNSAMEAKFAKDGEVTILRKTIEKNAQAHANEIAKLKAAKEAAHVEGSRNEKLVKNEMARLEAQLAFKKQELEANSRKFPSSIHPKKVLREPPATPSSSRGNRDAVFGRPTDVQQTPSKPPQGRGFNASKIPSPKKLSYKSPEKTRKPMLPGFQNAFSSTPLASSQQRNKGKGKAFESIGPFPVFSQPPPPTINPLSPPSPPIPPDVRAFAPELSSPVRPKSPHLTNEDIFMGGSLDEDGAFVMDNEEDFLAEGLEMLEPINWKAELSRIMLTHVRPTSGQLTLKLLLSSGVETGNISDLYIRAYSSMINALSYSAKMEDYDQILEIVCSASLTMAQVLSGCKLMVPLASLLNLLAVALYYIPKFRTHLYRQEEPGRSGISHILSIALDVLTSFLTPSNTDLVREALGIELLSLLEALCFGSTDDEILRFAEFVKNKEAMMVLLNPSQPLTLLQASVHLLVLLSSHRTLHHALLSIPDPQHDGDPESTEKNGILERLCSFLVDSSREGKEYWELKQFTLTFFAELSLGHPDVRSTLTASSILLASLVYHLHGLTTPLWEDDEYLMESRDASLLFAKYTSQCVYLIDRLASSNLRHRLQQAPPRPFNNILQMFVVAFGRLICASPPDWIDDSGRALLDQLPTMAQRIFDLVVVGPEGDAPWDVYCYSDKEKRNTDEETIVEESDVA